ncbi:NAD-dependent epimerase/dehydratase family protein [Antrihabitans cavernicola]|uniref:NAD-dependent epimerase/dehydratase family protein n=1 Tax=Antrihabitans cavernicola TaxID=2495913 RepID=A0A5A7SAK3_9NOCA|nr:NAD-dependent epimerase/dehydratase family protein [Spelaeibacter cavernicola]KAA0021241.1 NAD-dependent epimerase/dehydratase family protein [Spelaeibacter cavernicola]
MRVLITGGTGFVGAWSAKAIADAGHDVRFFVRNPHRLTTSAAKIGVDTSDYAIGDITDRASVITALDGCDAVLHAAALVATDTKHAEQMLATNIEGARNVLGTAARLGLDPIIHVSSFSALFTPDLDMLTTDLPVIGGKDAYGQSKAQVELYARGMQDGGAPVNITYPGMVLGPPAGDQFGEAAEGVQAALQMGLLPGRNAAWTLVDVRDLAAVHLGLIERGKGARRYMAGGTRVPLPELASMLGDASGKALHVLPVPDTVLRGVGKLVDQFDRFLPFDTPITEAAMQYYTQMPPADDSPSERELGVTYRDPRETLADTVAGLRAVGRL